MSQSIQRQNNTPYHMQDHMKLLHNMHHQNRACHHTWIAENAEPVVIHSTFMHAWNSCKVIDHMKLLFTYNDLYFDDLKLDLCEFVCLFVFFFYSDTSSAKDQTNPNIKLHETPYTHTPTCTHTHIHIPTHTPTHIHRKRRSISVYLSAEDTQ